MGCPSNVNLGDTLVFSITTHDPGSGILSDTETLPIYRIYANAVATPILTGTMGKLDDLGTTGFYIASVICSTGNGFAAGNTYTIYIEATVNGNTGGISYGCQVQPIPNDLSAAQIKSQIVEALSDDAYIEPGVGAPASAASLATKIGFLYKFLRNRVTQTSTTLTVYNDDGTTPAQTASVSDNGIIYDRGELT